MSVSNEGANKSGAFWLLIAATLGYFGIYYLLIAETKACTGTFISSKSFNGFFDRYLGCVGVNELGDALAGAFAPVAFLWLAGAVFIQSQELKAQRQELGETQQVMRQQLLVAKQQVAETRASTQLFEEQTRILKRQQEIRDQEIADETFNRMIEAFRMSIGNIGTVHIKYVEWKQEESRAGYLKAINEPRDKWETVFVPHDRLLLISSAELKDKGIHEISNCLVRYTHAASNRYASKKDVSTLSNWNEVRTKIEKLVDLFCALENQVPALSNGYRKQTEAMQLTQAREALQNTIVTFDHFDKNPGRQENLLEDINATGRA